MNSSSLVQNSLIFLSFLSIAHSGYSAYEYLSIVKSTGTIASDMPMDIVLQLFVSAVIFCVGSVMRAGEFKVVQMHLWTRDQPLEDLALLDIRKKRREYKLKRGTIAQTKT